MKIKLLIVVSEADYAGHLSSYISKHYADSFALCVSNLHQCEEMMRSVTKFDAALFDETLLNVIDMSKVTLPIMLADEASEKPDEFADLHRISKYQRLSSIVSQLLEKCSKETKFNKSESAERAQITAVWSPAGGVGKTTVALSYAASKVSEGKQVLYLNLEPFSSIPAYFDESAKSISAVFEMLESSESNLKLLIRSLYQLDRTVGVAYFSKPENFDDMNALRADNIAELTSVCAGVTQELIIDMSSVCDWRTKKVFEMANKVLIVTDATAAAEAKLTQFSTQHNIFESIKEKIVCVANKGASSIGGFEVQVSLPLIKSDDHRAVYKTLSGSFA